MNEPAPGQPAAPHRASGEHTGTTAQPGTAAASPPTARTTAQPGTGAAGQAVTWFAAPRLRRLAVVATAAMLAAVLTRHVSLLLLAAPALAALAAARRGAPAAVGLAVTASVSRCFEGEEVEIVATLATPVDEAVFRLAPDATVTLAGGPATQAVLARQGATARWLLKPRAWGRRVPCVVTVVCRTGGLWQTELEVFPPPVEVFPHPPPASAALVPAELLQRIGEHTARTTGAGIEFAGIRPYQPGDRLRDLNWPVTSRTGRPYVNQRAALRAADLVVMVDAFSEVGPPGATTLDLAVRGAAGLAEAYLRCGDRVGVVALGGVLRWLPPAPGHRQFFRIVEMTFGIRFPSEVTPDFNRVPRTALPPRAIVVLFSPLLDERAVTAIADLRQRGVSLVVVDVLRYEPPAMHKSQISSLALRLWRLDRRAMHAALGVPVLPWDGETSLVTTLAPVRRRPLQAARR
jgi:uncharacterized protein (DUF58 family)